MTIAVYSPNKCIGKYMLLKRVACVAYCPNSVAQHAPMVLDQSDTCVDLENYNWLPKYVAKRVLKIKELV